MARSVSTYVDNNSARDGGHTTSRHTADSELRTESMVQPKMTISSKRFNLMSTAESLSRNGLIPTITGSNDSMIVKKSKHSWKTKKKKKKKWWSHMDRESFRTLLMEQMNSKKVSSVLRKYMDEIPILNNKWSDQELVMIVCALIKMNRSEMALEVLRNQINEPDRDRLNRVAAASARLGNAQVAQGVLEITKYFNLQPDVVTYTSVIHACARGGKGDVPMALHYLNEMIVAGVEPNARTYGAAVLAYAQLGRWEEIKNLLCSIAYTDDAHKKEVFTCAIVSCSRNRKHDYASRLFELLLEDGVYPGDNVCNAALSSCARTSDLTQIRRISKLLELHATPSIYSYNCMISAFGNACKMDEAMQEFEKMRENLVATPDIVTFNSLLVAAVRSREVHRIPFILSLMNKAGLKWDAYTLNILLQGCGVNGDVKMAEHYWLTATEGKAADADQPLDMHRISPDRAHFENLMGVYYAATDYKAVVDLWQKNKLCRRRTKSSKALNFLIRACKGLKDDKMAMTILSEFADRGHPLSPITHHHMLEVFLAADKYTDALAYMHKMIKVDGTASIFAFTLLMKYLAKKNRHSDVLEMFDLYLDTREASTKGQSPLLHFPTDAIYVLMFRSAVELQDHETVLMIYDNLPTTMSVAVRTELLRLAIASCEHEGDWRTAVTLYDDMTGRLDEDINVELYKQVVKIVASAGEFDRALDVGGGEWYRQNRPDKGWGL
ncbi:hypothetical protein KXD40_002363 [Peronospora effusa]|nr:hypothetical protein KXD40_002363 [Peronospora effusa]